MKVLVYEEDESRIEQLKDILNQEDYDVVLARNGDALFGFLEDEVPDLVVSNFGLPKGGYELVNAILARVQHPFPYVLFLTEKENEKYVVDCLGPIPGDFVSLPLREEALQARMVVAEKAIALQEYLRSQDKAPPGLAMYDPETNLLNKQAVYDRGLVEISRSHRENQTVGVALMELINVDAIRSQYGDELAALAVRFIANTLRANIRMYDIVGRWTPACFLILIPGVPAENTGGVVTRLYQAVSEVKIPLMDDSLLEMKLAVGYTCAVQEDTRPLSDIVGRAEKAVFNAGHTDDGPRVVAFSEVG